MSSVANVRLWLFDLKDTRLDSYEPLLDASERELGKRMRFGLRFQRCRGAVRVVLGRELSRAPEQLVFAYGPNGKPELPGIEFNVSHSGDLAVLATSFDAPLGVDVEEVRSNMDWQELAQRFLKQEARTPEEFFELWTAREAYLKGTGEGIGGGLSSPMANGWRIVPLAVPATYRGALAVRAEEIRVNVCSLVQTE